MPVKNKPFTISKKSSFSSTDPYIKILDENRNVFYEHPNEERHITFNLPVGTYFSDNDITQLHDFIPYNPIPYAGDKFVPNNFNIVEGENPHKASIWPSDGKTKILIDPSVGKMKYKPCTYFIIGHELGHMITPGTGPKPQTQEEKDECEENCDIFSCNKCMNAGLNSTQLEIAARMLLENNPERWGHLRKVIRLLKNRR